jgi:hypothetical protein
MRAISRTACKEAAHALRMGRLRIFSQALCLSARPKAPRGVGVIFSRGMAHLIIKQHRLAARDIPDAIQPARSAG